MKSNKLKSYDVIIVGAGMIGSALALALAQQEFKVAVIDQSQRAVYLKDSIPDIRISALNITTIALLKRLNVWRLIETMRSCAYRSVSVWEQQSAIWSCNAQRLNQTTFSAQDIGCQELGFIVENKVVQVALMESLIQNEYADLYYPDSIDQIDLTNPVKQIHLLSGQCLSSRLLVGADGVNSKIRQCANIGMSSSQYWQQCLVSTVEILGNQQDTTWQAFTPTGPKAFLPLMTVNNIKYASVVWYHQPNIIKQLMQLSAQELIDTLAFQFPKELPHINKIHQRSVFSLSKSYVDTYYKKGIVLVGDAAHTVNPLAGQGANLGFQDVIWLVQALIDAKKESKNLDQDDVLAYYENNCRQQNLLMMRAMDFFYYSFSNQKLPLTLFRNIALMLAGKIKPFTNEMIAYASGIRKQPDWL